MPTTHYHPETPAQVKTIIESLLANRHVRIRVWYGSPSGHAWNEEYDVTGYIGRSTGTQPIPLLVNNARSMGGDSLSTHCIVRIDTTAGRTLYKHPAYHNDFDRAEIKQGDDDVYPYEVHIKNELHSRHKTRQQAQNYIDFMTGKRYTK